jgi:hypothetical protein
MPICNPTSTSFKEPTYTYTNADIPLFTPLVRHTHPHAPTYRLFPPFACRYLSQRVNRVERNRYGLHLTFPLRCCCVPCSCWRFIRARTARARGRASVSQGKGVVAECHFGQREVELLFGPALVSLSRDLALDCLSPNSEMRLCRLGPRPTLYRLVSNGVQWYKGTRTATRRSQS